MKCALLIALTALPLTAEAQVQMTGLEGEAGVSFSATSLLSDLESFGFAPIVLEVKNDTEAEPRRLAFSGRAWERE